MEIDEQQHQKDTESGFPTPAETWMTGVDRTTLRLCPQHDWDNVRAIALIMIAVWIYQTAIFTMVAHGMLAPGSTFHPEFLLASLFIASFVLLIDSYMVMRSGWHLHGINELKRGGIDISGGPWLQIKNGIFLVLRILLSVALAQLCAVFTALILFRADIDSEIKNYNQAQNAPIIASVKARTEGDIKRATDAVNAEEARVTALTNEISAARQKAIDPSTNDSQMRAAEEEVRELVAEKAKRDSELVAAQAFAANELAGIQGENGNSGIAGRGPVRLAAEEKVRTATANAASAAKALAEARTRLDELHKQIGSASSGKARQAQAQLPGLEANLKTATVRLDAARKHLADLTDGRDEAIRVAIQNAPDRVVRDEGFLGRLAALRRIARDPEIAAIIILIDLTSFGLELAAVLAKVTSFIPTTYSALLARNAYVKTVQIVEEMERTINRGPRKESGDIEILEPGLKHPEDGEAMDHGAADVARDDDSDWPSDGSGPVDSGKPDSPRRGRGRPRKPVPELVLTTPDPQKH